MSLVTVIASPDFALVASDGRLSQRGPGGSTTVVREDCPKFTPLGAAGVLCATGRGDLCDDVTAMVLQLLRHVRGPVPLNALMTFIEATSTAAFRAYPVHGPDVALNVTLVAPDPTEQRIRVVSWADSDGFAQHERPDSSWRMYAFGDFVHPALDRLTRGMHALLPNPTLGQLQELMQDTLRGVARECPSINDRAYFAMVTLDRS